MAMQQAYPHLFAPRDGYVFIVTYGRAGSTLLQVLLNSITGFCIRGENANAGVHLARTVHAIATHEMIQQRRAARDLPNADQPSYIRGLLGTPRDPWFGAENLDERALAMGLFDCFVRDVLRPPPDARVLGFKEIRYAEDPTHMPDHLAVFDAVFPAPKFVFLSRDWQEVARSAWWQKHRPEDVRRTIEATDAAFARFAQGRSNCHVIDHAAFGRGPEGVADLFAFLGEAMDEARVAKILRTRLRH